MASKIIKIGKKEVPMKATGALPRQYRAMFGKDFFSDIAKLENADGNFDTCVLENIAFLMAEDKGKQSIEKWLEQFELFDVIGATEEIITLWGDSSKITVDIERFEDEEGGEKNA